MPTARIETYDENGDPIIEATFEVEEPKPTPEERIAALEAAVEALTNP